jgi:hypothetical protein
MSNAGRGAPLPTDSAATVDAITRAYVGRQEVIRLRLCGLPVADALYTLTEMDRRARQVERMVSRGFTRGAFQRSDPA